MDKSCMHQSKIQVFKPCNGPWVVSVRLLQSSLRGNVYTSLANRKTSSSGSSLSAKHSLDQISRWMIYATTTFSKYKNNNTKYSAISKKTSNALLWHCWESRVVVWISHEENASVKCWDVPNVNQTVGVFLLFAGMLIKKRK